MSQECFRPLSLSLGLGLETLSLESKTDCHYNCHLYCCWLLFHQPIVLCNQPILLEIIPGLVLILESHGIYKSHFPGLESPGIRHSSWKVMEIRIAGVTNFLMISLDDY